MNIHTYICIHWYTYIDLYTWAYVYTSTVHEPTYAGVSLQKRTAYLSLIHHEYTAEQYTCICMRTHTRMLASYKRCRMIRTTPRARVVYIKLVAAILLLRNCHNMPSSRFTNSMTAVYIICMYYKKL